MAQVRTSKGVIDSSIATTNRQIYSLSELQTFFIDRDTLNRLVVDAIDTGRTEQLNQSVENTVSSLERIAATGCSSVFPVPAELLPKNSEITRPLLMNAVAGDLESQNLYSSVRVISYETLPVAAQALVWELAKAQYQKVNPLDALPPSLRRIDRTKLNKQKAICCPPFAQLHLETAGTYIITTYSVARGVLETLNHVTSVKVLSQEMAAQSGYGGRFTPMDHTLYGEAARKAWSHMIDAMLTARILTDMLEHFGVTLSDRAYSRFLKSVPSPWQIGNTTAGRNLPVIVEALEEADFAADNPRRQELICSLLFDRDPLKRLEHILNPTKNEVVLVDPETPHVQRLGWNSNEQSFRQQTISAIKATITQYCADCADLDTQARYLFATICRGMASYPEIISGLIETGSPDALLARIRAARAGTTNEAKDSTPQLSVEETVTLATDTELSGFIVNALCETPSKLSVIEQQLVDAASEVRKIIQTRIDRMKRGLLGSICPILGCPGAFETRIDSGPGYRIYFRFHNDRVIELISYGIKDTQTRDIALLPALIAKQPRVREL